MNANAYLYSVLTCITNHYEKIHEVQNPNPNVEYVCVTDDPELKSDTWKIIYKENIWFFDIKHNPFKYISTNVCLWLDGCYQIKNDFTDNFIKPFINSNKEFMISLHDRRCNVYDELAQWWLGRGISTKNIKAITYIYTHNNFTGISGLCQTSCFLVKKTNDTELILSKWREIEKQCSITEPYREDQTTITFILFKLFDKNKLLLMDFEYTSNNKYFHMCAHNSNIQYHFKSYFSTCFNKDQELYKIGQNN